MKRFLIVVFVLFWVFFLMIVGAKKLLADAGCITELPYHGGLTDTQTLAIDTTTYNDKTSIESFNFYPDRNEIEVIYRTVSPWRYPEGGGPPDDIGKIVYGVVDGKITKLKTIEGKHVPRRVIEEHIEWPEE